MMISIQLAGFAWLLATTACDAFYTKALRLPILNPSSFTVSDDTRLVDSVTKRIQSLGFFKPCPKVRGKFFVPAFGEDASLSFKGCSDDDMLTHYEVLGKGMSKEDFGWLCGKLSDKTEDHLSFYGLDVTLLQQVKHKSAEAFFSTTEGDRASYDNKMVESILSANLMEELREEGFIVLDTYVKTSEESNQLLSQVLSAKTDQPEDIRSDSVKFLDKEIAQECSVEDQRDLLLGIASYLNKNMEMEPSGYEPLTPATREFPLTNPSKIQAAEYRQNEYYVTHSDNSLHGDGLRVDHRTYTCILYCNEQYSPGDGGELRLYLGTENVLLNKNMEYPSLEEFKKVDIEPYNGRLLIFDSRFLHSVQKVHQDHYPRQALTVWISKPEDRPLHGDVFVETKG